MANGLLDARFVSCGQISGIESIFEWEGERRGVKEWLLTVKTDKRLYGECEAFIKKRHSYKVPQIIAVDVVCASGEYAEWVKDCVISTEEA